MICTPRPELERKPATKLEEAGFGQLENLLTASPEDLENVEGIGGKTARAILAWAQEIASAEEQATEAAEKTDGDAQDAAGGEVSEVASSTMGRQGSSWPP